jgi:osmotically-inducible protein OsmY
MLNKAVLTLIAGLFLSLLQGCAPAVVGGTAVGVSVLHDRRPADVVLADERTELRISAAIGEDKSLSEHCSVSATSYNRVVLLTGRADTPEVADRIRALAAGKPWPPANPGCVGS